MYSALTPIENAFEYMGLDRSLALVHFIFVESVLGKVIFILGFVWALYRGVNQASVRPFLVFCAVFFSGWMLFVLPSVSVSVVPSVMEDRGFRDLTTSGILRKRGFNDLRGNPVLLSGIQLLNGLTNNMIAVLERSSAQGDGFLKSPFLAANLSVLTGRILERGLVDARLKERTAGFCLESYLPAVRRIAEEHDGMVSFRLWPGDEAVIAHYSAQERQGWKVLRDDLYSFFNGKNKVFEQAQRFMDQGDPDKDAVARDFLDAELGRNAQEYGVVAYQAQQKRLFDPVILAASASFTTARWVLSEWPYIYGGLLFLWYVFFPVYLIIVFVRGDIILLVDFIKSVVVLKLCPLVLAVLNECAVILYTRFSSEGLWRAEGVNVFVSVGVIGILGAGAWIALQCLIPRGSSGAMAQGYSARRSG